MLDMSMFFYFVSVCVCVSLCVVRVSLCCFKFAKSAKV